MNRQPNHTITITAEPDAPLAPYTPDPRAAFAAQFQAALALSVSTRRQQWREIEDAWLHAKYKKTNSPHTLTNYRRRLRAWQEFLSRQIILDPNGDPTPLEMWEADHTHVRRWIDELTAAAKKPATIGHHIACVSSFYSFVIHEKRLINGVEIDLFIDRLGNPRANPFRTGNIPRPKPDIDRPYPLTVLEYDALLTYLEQHTHTLAGARNHALLLTYLHTGWRSSELLRMRWGDIRPTKNKRGYVFAWAGKGGKKDDDALPIDCYNAIHAYLRLAGRILPGHDTDIADSEYIWLPVAEPSMTGLIGHPTPDPNRPISDKSALRILRTAARHAGIQNWQRLRIHDLRHTHAALLDEAGESYKTIRDRLHHSNIATTDRYMRTIRRTDPVDTHTPKFQQLRLRLHDADE